MPPKKPEEDDDEEEEEEDEEEEEAPPPAAAKPQQNDDEFDHFSTPASQSVAAAAAAGDPAAMRAMSEGVPRPSSSVRRDEEYARSVEAAERDQIRAQELQANEDAALAARLEREDADAAMARRLEQEAADEALARRLDTEKLRNAPHDEALEADEDDEHVATPRENAPAAPSSAIMASEAERRLQQAPMDTEKLHNAPHDEALDVEGDEADDDDDSVPTPEQSPTRAQQPMAVAETAGGRMLANQVHDEAVDVDDHHIPSPKVGGGYQKPMAEVASVPIKNSQHDEAVDLGDSDGDSVSSEEEDKGQQQRSMQPMGGISSQANQFTPVNTKPQNQVADDDEESTSEEEEDDMGTETKKPSGSTYNPAEYSNLQVSKEIKDLFLSIQKYTPHDIELDCKLKPFIPDYIPAVGDIDTFVKIPRPDNRTDMLGLTVLDEPTTQPSNPAVVKLGLAYQTKSSHKPSEFVESIDDAGKRTTLIDKWISDISNLHKKKPAPTVHYTQHMPDVEQLLQVWPPDFEDLLTRGSILELPPAQLNVELYQYVKIVCTMLDVPVYKNIIESLHVLFTLYSEFKANQHFQNGPELSPE
mmetsp:Transcript_58985/g.97811  ORF Transcript_58985/g.97811 Transcript_58985/m.97811 type:complete len:587 (+) Transcript_58985:78-1838(+)